MTIPLSDASVKVAARAIYESDLTTTDIEAYPFDGQPKWHKQRLVKDARAAITAYLQTEIEAGRARKARGGLSPNQPGEWLATTAYANAAKIYKDNFPALILSLEPSK